jgi:hypothetical protein
MPVITVKPMKIEMPRLQMAPIAIPRVTLAPMKVVIPKIKIDPVKIVVVPRRVVL